MLLGGIIGIMKMRQLKYRNQCKNINEIDDFCNNNSNLNIIGISLGYNCHSAIWGTKAGYRLKKQNGYKTCPFDIMFTNLKGIINCLNDDFKYMSDEKYLILDNDYIINTKYNFVFNHESPGQATDLLIKEEWEGINHFVQNNYKNFKERYQNRIKNFNNYLTDTNNAIIFILTGYNVKQEDLRDLKYIINLKYPKLKYVICVLDDAAGQDSDSYLKRFNLEN